MNIIIASNNAHKIREFREILDTHIIMSPHDLGIEFDHEETADSFAMNAVGKATTLWRQIQQQTAKPRDYWVVADDSGICVDALQGAPGVYSARYGYVEGQPPLSDADRNNLLLRNMASVSDRRAHYVCCMALVRGDDQFDCVQETWQGKITPQISSGTGGFGYDPLFFLEEHQCTVAELGQGIKSQISHRAKAMRRLLALLS